MKYEGKQHMKTAMRRFFALCMVIVTMASAVATAESIKVEKGIWTVGEDFPAGHYLVEASSQFIIAYECDKLNEDGHPALNAEHIVRLMGNDTEFVFTEGMYFSLPYGECIILTPVVLTESQRDNETYMEMTKWRQEAIKDLYNHQDEMKTTLQRGLYIVGEDIPEGNWCFCAWGEESVVMSIGDATEIQIFTLCHYLSESYEPGCLTRIYIHLDEGDAINIASPQPGGMYVFPYEN